MIDLDELERYALRLQSPRDTYDFGDVEAAARLFQAASALLAVVRAAIAYREALTEQQRVLRLCDEDPAHESDEECYPHGNCTPCDVHGCLNAITTTATAECALDAALAPFRGPT